MPPLTPPTMRSRLDRVRRRGARGGGLGGGASGVSDVGSMRRSVGPRDAAAYWESSLGSDPRVTLALRPRAAPRLDRMDLLERVRATGLLPAGAPVVALLSGGRDS